jgi:predicted AAA+ superfamily ATPase
MSKELGISVNTVKNWLSVLEASNIIFILPPYYSNIGKRLVKGFKIYFFDVGYACYLTGIKTEEMLLKGPMSGQLFENFIVMEMFKKYFNSGIRPRAYFLRTEHKLEVDLLIESGQKLYPFEIKLSMTPTFKMAVDMEKIIDLLGKKAVSKGAVICLVEKDTYLSAKTDVLTLDSFLKIIGKLSAG